MELIMNESNQLHKGDRIFEEGTRPRCILIVLKGHIMAKNTYITLLHGPGSFLGVVDSFIGNYVYNYVAVDEAVVKAIPIVDKRDIKPILDEHKEYRGLLVNSCARMVYDVYKINSQVHSGVSLLYETLKNKYTSYRSLCTDVYKTGNRLPHIENCAEYEPSVAIKKDLIKYYVDCARIPIDAQKAYFAYSSDVTYRHVSEAVVLISQMIADTSEASDYAKAIFPLLYGDADQCLVCTIGKLAKRINRKGDAGELVSLLDDAIDGIRAIDLAINSKSNKRIDINLERLLKLRETIFDDDEEEQEEAVEAVDIAVLDDSLTQILEYGHIDEASADAFRKKIEEFLNMPDRMSADDEYRPLRRGISEAFFNVYEKVFKRAYNGERMSKPVELFLNFGFVDERLLSEHNRADLLRLKIEKDSSGPAQVYSMYEWLSLIYAGEKEPSKNEFDMEYNEYLRDERKSARITEEQEKEMQKNQELKLHFEINNMYKCNARVVNGQLSLYVPILFDDQIMVSLKKAFVSKELVNKAVSEVVDIDYSAFYREQLYVNMEKGIEREYVMKEVFPDIVLVPVYGINASMWQDISCKRRDTPGRFLFPAFTDVILKDLMVKCVGRFRWEFCRTVQGAAWNNVQIKSLTSEFSDYIQFYKKNKDLSAERKEKIKTQLQKAKKNSREVFTMDYELWIKSEAVGGLKLDKVAREILAVYCPFNRSLREKLATQPAFEECMARYKRETAKKTKEIEFKHHAIVKKGGQITPELEETLSFYRDL